jgi:integrase
VLIMAATNSTPGKNLTDTFIRKAKVGTYPDAAHPGLRLRVGKTRKSWLYRYRDSDRLKQITLGQYLDNPSPQDIEKARHMSLADARAKLDSLRAARQAGQDVQREHQQEEEGPFTVTRLVDLYLDGYAKLIKRSWREDKRMLELDITQKWGDRLASEITRTEAMGLLTEMVPRGERGAQLLLAAARKAWNFAIDRERVQINPFARLKIVKGVVMGAGTRVRVNKPKPRCLRGAELKIFLAKLETANLRPAIRDILLLQLLTASRKGEVCAIRWDEVDTAERVWTLPAAKAKNEQEHRVMLSEQAYALIDAQPRINDYVFGVKRRNLEYMRPDTVNDAVTRTRDHFELGHWTPHTLRHSALTGLSELGASRWIQNRVSNHVDRTIGDHYDHNEMDAEARAWLQKWADHLDSLRVENVVPLDIARA